MPVLVSPTDLARGEQAIQIVLADEWKTFLDYDGRVSWSIPSMSGSHYYKATEDNCTCPDQKYRPWVACKHQLAVRLALDLAKEEAPAF